MAFQIILGVLFVLMLIGLVLNVLEETKAKLLLTEATKQASKGLIEFNRFFLGLTVDQKVKLLPNLEALKTMAEYETRRRMNGYRAP